MSRGLASLRGYQEGGEIPDVFAKMLAAIRSGASQQALPDTLKGEKRAQMMRALDRFGADTTQINQKGIYDLFRGGELEELLELVSQMAEREAPFTRYGTDKRTGIGEASYVSPHILEEDRPITVEPYSNAGLYSNTGGRYRMRGRYIPESHHVRLNFLPAFAPTLIRGTQESLEASPEERVRGTILHELGHGIGSPNERGWFPRSDEVDADNFAAVLEAVLNASPEDTKRDVLDEAQKLYWARSNAYKYRLPDLDPETGVDDNQFRANLRAGWAGRQQFSGIGGRDDPYVIDPYYMERMERAQRDQMRPFLRRILLTPMYEGHPLNEPTAEEGLRGGWHRGIQSLRSGLSNLWDRVRS